MTRRYWILALGAALVSSVGGVWAYARGTGNSCASGCCGSATIVCPITGEELPECCCPLKSQAAPD